MSAASTLIDSNILIDLLTDHPDFGDRAHELISLWSTRGRLIINPVVYAEVSVAYRRIEDYEAILNKLPLVMAEIPRSALFLAGKVYREYRRKGGTRTGTLPDFFIGAHAAVAGLTLLSRDGGRYTHYFPRLTVVS